MKLFRTLTIVVSLALMSACATTPPAPVAPVSTAHDNLNSTLWVQTAAEYQANVIQTYRAASMQLDQAIADTGWIGALEYTENSADLPPAIILDVDETIVDNSPYQAQMIKDGTSFDIETWDNWVSMAKAPALPGAVEFINEAAEKGVFVVFLTNRECRKRPNSDHPCPQQLDTMANLKAIGINEVTEAQTLLKYAQPDWTSEKRSRREVIAQTHRILMLFGDDFGDFLPDVKKNITYQQRAELVTENLARWGTHWYALPNPTYGSWNGVLSSPKKDNLRGYE